MSARAHPGSLPPPHSTSAPPHVSGHAIQPAVSPSAGKKIALAGALLFVAFGIAFAVVMATRGKKADDTKLDASVIAQPTDAAVRQLPDGPVVVVVPDGSTSADASEWSPPVPVGSCADHCKRAAACGLRLNSCELDCTDAPNRRCLETATTCEQMAGCYWARRCGRPVKNGSKTCIQALDCYALGMNSGMAISTICQTCIDEYSPSAALLRAKYYVCNTNATDPDRPRTDGVNGASRCDELTCP